MSCEWPRLNAREGMNMTRIENFVPEIYAAAAGPQGLAGALPGLCTALGARTGSFWVAKGGAITAYASTLEPEAVGTYFEHFHRLDPWAERYTARGLAPQPRAGVAPLRAATGESLLSGRELEASEFFQDWAEPNGVYHVMGAMLPLAGAAREVMTLAVQRPREARAFREAERRRLEALLPHLQRAAQIERRLAGMERRARAGAAAFDALPFGVAVVGPGGTLLYANAGLEALARDGGLRLGGGKDANEVRTARAADAQALRRLLHDVAGGGAGGLAALARPGRAPLEALVSPLPRSLGGAADDGSPWALVLVREPECRAGPWLAAFARAYGLTAAETAVAAALAEGLDPAGVAERQNVSLTTVRSQVAAVVKKAGGGGLRELTRRLAGWGAVAPSE